jgi:hypothetical protein
VVLPLEPQAGDVPLQEAKVWLHEAAESDRRRGSGVPRVLGAPLPRRRGAAARRRISPADNPEPRSARCMLRVCHAQGLGGHPGS